MKIKPNQPAQLELSRAWQYDGARGRVVGNYSENNATLWLHLPSPDFQLRIQDGDR